MKIVLIVTLALAMPMVATARPKGVVKLPALKPPLTIRYFAQGDTAVIIETSPNQKLACKGETNAVGLPGLTRCEGGTTGATVAITVVRKAADGKTDAVTGKQWQGDCTGTSSSTCTLTLTKSREVLIDFNA